MFSYHSIYVVIFSSRDERRFCNTNNINKEMHVTIIKVIVNIMFIIITKILQGSFGFHKEWVWVQVVPWDNNWQRRPRGEGNMILVPSYLLCWCILWLSSRQWHRWNRGSPDPIQGTNRTIQGSTWANQFHWTRLNYDLQLTITAKTVHRFPFPLKGTRRSKILSRL